MDSAKVELRHLLMLELLGQGAGAGTFIPFWDLLKASVARCLRIFDCRRALIGIDVVTEGEDKVLPGDHPLNLSPLHLPDHGGVGG